MENFLINLIIGILVFVGFFVYWGRAAGWYKEGGVVYELWHEFRSRKKQNKQANKKVKNKDKDNNSNNNV